MLGSPLLRFSVQVFAVLRRRAASTPLALPHVAFASRARMFVCFPSVDARLCTCMHAVGLSCLSALFSAFLLVALTCLPPVSSVPFLFSVHAFLSSVFCFFLVCSALTWSIVLLHM